MVLVVFLNGGNSTAPGGALWEETMAKEKRSGVFRWIISRKIQILLHRCRLSRNHHSQHYRQPAMFNGRELVKGHLQAPITSPCPKSYTQTPQQSAHGVAVRKQKPVSVVEFSSQAVPQPFLEPASIMNQRIEMVNQAKGGR